MLNAVTDLAQVATPPVPLDRQISRVRAELAIATNVKMRQMRFGRIHPTTAAIELAELRAALHTLEGLRDKAPVTTSSDDVGA